MIRWARPAYPPELASAGVEGSVRLDLRIDPTGKPIEITMAQRSESPQLDQAVVGAANLWRFAPPRWDSEPVAVSARIEIRYNCFSVEFSRLGEMSSEAGGRGNTAERVNNGEPAVRRFIQQLQSAEDPFDRRSDAGLQRLTAAIHAWGPVTGVKYLRAAGEPEWRSYTIEPKDRSDPLESSVTVRWELYRVEHDGGSSLMKVARDGSDRVRAAKAEVISPTAFGASRVNPPAGAEG